MVRFGPLAIALLAFTGAAQPSATAADMDREQVVATVLSQLIVPGFSAFAVDSAEFASASEALCVRPDAERLNVAQDRWQAAAVRWNRLLPYRFGPMRQSFPASLEWQIDTNLVPGGIRKAAIRDAVEQVLDANYPIDIGVVARQKLFARGLHAIELMLHEAENGMQDKTAVLPSFRGRTGERKCAYLAAMASYIQLLAEELAAGWKSLAEAPPSSAEHPDRNPSVLFDALVNQSIALLDFVERNKLRVVMGEQAGAAEEVEAAASDASLALIRANVEGVNATFAAGFDQLLKQSGDSSLVMRYDALYQSVLCALDAISEPLTEAATANPAALEALAAALSEWRHLLRLEISQALGVTPNFTESDGD